MDSAVTIQDFHALLNSNADSTLLGVLRRLTTTQKPEDVRLLSSDDPDDAGINQSKWGGWAWTPTN